MEYGALRFCKNFLATLKFNGIDKFSYMDLNNILEQKLSDGEIILPACVSSCSNYLKLDRGLATITMDSETAFNIVNKITENEKIRLNDLVNSYKNSLPGAISVERFILMLLSVLSNNDQVLLPADYRYTIEDVFTDSKYEKLFECFIDYIDCDINMFVNGISKFLDRYVKNAKYDFINNQIVIPFSDELARKVIKLCDSITIEKIELLSNLLKKLPNYNRQLEMFNKGCRTKGY